MSKTIPDIMKTVTPSPSLKSISKTASSPTPSISQQSKMKTPVFNDNGVYIMKMILVIGVLAFLIYNIYIYYNEGTDILGKYLGIGVEKTADATGAVVDTAATGSKKIVSTVEKGSDFVTGGVRKGGEAIRDVSEAMKYTHAVVDFKRSLKKFSDAKVIGFTTNEKDAKFMAKNALTGTKGTVVKLKKPMSQKKGDMMINRPLEEEVELSETIVDFDYSRNPKAIFNAFLQMSRRLNLTLFNAPTGMKDLQSKGTGRIGGTKQNMLKFMKYLNSKGIEPKVEIINEQSSDFFKKARMKAGLPPTPTARSAAGYELFHKTFSGAMQHAYAMAKKNMGMIVIPKEIDDKVATGPKKPGVGRTNRYSLKTNKGVLQIQVYNRGGSKPFELNMYS